ncbi:MAG: hypothetical protein JNL38_35950 [Myxococcales bacterium]|nr:hypothetical protein [Myxococcales bacterium]
MASAPKHEPVLVRLALAYFQRRERDLPAPSAEDAVHYLNPKERAAIRRVARGMVLRAAGAGALSAAVAAAVEVLAQPLAEAATPDGTVRFWALVGVATVLASAIEIGFLYWDGLRSVHALARAAGLSLSEEGAIAELPLAMARVALELPNPRVQPYGIDPLREVSRWRLVVAGLVYKAKIGVTNFLLKALVRRVLGRAVVRAWLPFVGVPVTAAWNAWVAWTIVREATLRVMGPSAAFELAGALLDRGPPPSEALKEAVLRALATSIVKKQDFHPNLAAFLEAVVGRIGMRNDGDLDDPGVLLERLGTLAPSDAAVVVRALAIAAILDGRVTRRERETLVRAAAAARLELSLAAVERLRRAFVKGEGLTEEQVLALVSVPAASPAVGPGIVSS